MSRWQDAHGPTWNGLDTELSPGQSWAIPADGPWQARIGRDGYAHVIGRALAGHPEYSAMYFSGRGAVDRDLPWSDFDTAMAAARRFNAAKRQAAQAGQGGE